MWILIEYIKSSSIVEMILNECGADPRWDRRQNLPQELFYLLQICIAHTSLETCRFKNWKVDRGGAFTFPEPCRGALVQFPDAERSPWTIACAYVLLMHNNVHIANAPWGLARSVSIHRFRWSHGCAPTCHPAQVTLVSSSFNPVFN